LIPGLVLKEEEDLAVYPCSPNEPLLLCTSSMDTLAFQAYTTFYAHVVRRSKRKQRMSAAEKEAEQ
jgi:hypothetical protein